MKFSKKLRFYSLAILETTLVSFAAEEMKEALKPEKKNKNENENESENENKKNDKNCIVFCFSLNEPKLRRIYCRWKQLKLGGQE